eukprot:GILJ01002256.1.p1 GENE.GILJ01002256.1~~GILJ01002256.1.p1  ORF type:complete len:547 (-),score=92.28 GILJ01002256.1:661-2214(-)
MKTFLVLAVLLCAASAAFIRVNPSTNTFVDGDGRARIFHGVNAVYKKTPYYPIYDHWSAQNSLSEKDADDLANWGFNVVRLGLMWPGYETARGQYDESYLDAIEKIVDILAQRNIYTILDMHQDLLNEKFCGEGIPDYAAIVNKHTLPFPMPVSFHSYKKDAHGYPDREDCKKKAFGVYYFAAATAAAWQNLYDNVDGVLDSWAEFWRRAAARFVNKEAVLGYELINEPWWGNHYGNPGLIIPSVADKKNLVPMYKKAHAAIRSVDNNHIIFYEPVVAFDQFTPVGFTEGPGGEEYNDRQAFSYHIYCLQDKSGDPVSRKLCNVLEKGMLKPRIADAKRLKTAGILTEFGANTDGAAGVGELNFITKIADEDFQSWCYWQYKNYDDITTAGDANEGFYNATDGFEAAKVKALSRTYAQVIAGVPQSMSFDDQTAEFVLTYSPLKQGNVLVTEVYVNKQLHYPTGVDVSVTPADVVQVAQTDSVVQFTHAAGTNVDLISIRIGRAQGSQSLVPQVTHI